MTVVVEFMITISPTGLWWLSTLLANAAADYVDKFGPSNSPNYDNLVWPTTHSLTITSRFVNKAIKAI